MDRMDSMSRSVDMLLRDIVPLRTGSHACSSRKEISDTLRDGRIHVRYSYAFSIRRLSGPKLNWDDSDVSRMS